MNKYNALLEENDISVLRNLIDKKLISIKSEYKIEDEEVESYGNILLNIENNFCEVRNEYKKFGNEEYPVISCNNLNMECDFKPMVVKEYTNTIFNQKIRKISITNELIDIPSQNFSINMCVAIKFELENCNLTIYKDSFFMEELYIVQNKNFNEICSIQNSKELWTQDDKKVNINITRENISLEKMWKAINNES